MENNLIICPGCGLKISSNDKSLDKDFNASVVCRNLCFEVSYFTLGLGDKYFLHQLLVDAYAAQHSGEHVKSISTAFGLAGLYLVWERGYTGRQVQHMHIDMAKRSKVWPRFPIPESKDWMTIKDVLDGPKSERQDLIKKWHKSVWDVWKVQEEKIAQLVKGLMI